MEEKEIAGQEREREKENGKQEQYTPVAANRVLENYRHTETLMHAFTNSANNTMA
jgi:hypothetical protein